MGRGTGNGEPGGPGTLRSAGADATQRAPNTRMHSVPTHRGCYPDHAHSSAVFCDLEPLPAPAGALLSRPQGLGTGCPSLLPTWLIPHCLSRRSSDTISVRTPSLTWSVVQGLPSVLTAFTYVPPTPLKYDPRSVVLAPHQTSERDSMKADPVLFPTGSVPSTQPRAWPTISVQKMLVQPSRKGRNTCS